MGAGTVFHVYYLIGHRTGSCCSHPQLWKVLKKRASFIGELCHRQNGGRVAFKYGNFGEGGGGDLEMSSSCRELSIQRINGTTRRWGQKHTWGMKVGGKWGHPWETVLTGNTVKKNMGGTENARGDRTSLRYEKDLEGPYTQCRLWWEEKRKNRSSIRRQTHRFYCEHRKANLNFLY